ncbi:MAG: biosynthetic peptidoglycan transglycosylase, partial [Bdellovibrionota bacterium]
IVMSEDSEFFEHDGINVEAIIDAIAVNLRTQKNTIGASTISQQVAKNLFLEFEKSYVRKIKEFMITRDIERRFTKNQILELYLNLAEFGPDIFGVEAAGQHYFGKKASAINAAEGAFIALMLPSPRRLHYSVYQNQNLTDARRKRIRRVLQDMLYNEFITEGQFAQYVRYPYFKKESDRSTASAQPPAIANDETTARRSRSKRRKQARIHSGGEGAVSNPSPESVDPDSAVATP